ncbi:hypothetical protein PR202_ga22870 [Eleusine coracana subsp. coracana]|uniref:Potassium transporter n=1 Tax=Eleusine coracana subsp. coracana TaxID=191504 RepID=A0AAV5D4U3_ELECO|nr:hypothetical protein PR202_ga22870 [Eleusine coracana subsp. coracana]
MHGNDDVGMQKEDWVSRCANLIVLAYQSCGVVYGDLSTSPLYVYKSTFSGSLRKNFLEKHRKSRTFLLVMVLFGASLVIGDGVLTPAMSVLSSFSGLQVHSNTLTNGQVVLLSCIVLVCLFTLQHWGTSRVAFLFAPVVIIWLLCLAAIGIYNIAVWNPRVLRALSPIYLVRFFQRTGRDGWISLGGVLLSMTGTEAMYADLGHFTADSIRYMGQAAFLSKSPDCDMHFVFFESVPRRIFWPVLVLATLAAIVGSQAVISATFSIVRQCSALGCFPRVKIVHTSRRIHGQIYSPEINWILLVVCLAVTIGFRDTNLIGNAYGMACAGVMVVTTLLMSLVMVFVWQQGVVLASLFLLAFLPVEAAYLSASVMKVPQGGWLPLALSLLVVFVMYVWHYGTRRRHLFDVQNKVSLKWLHALGPSLGIVRVPGIGLIYSELATGVPAIFSHFVTNLPAFHQVLVFVCVKAVPVPHVRKAERHLIGRVGPREFRMYRCVVRHGYKDVLADDYDFENDLVLRLAEFVHMEAAEQQQQQQRNSDGSVEGRMAIVNRPIDPLEAGLHMRRPFFNSLEESLVVRAAVAANNADNATTGKSETLQSLQTMYEVESPGFANRRRVQFEINEEDGGQMDPAVREELRALVEAKHAGVAYIMGHSYIKARKNSSVFKKFAIDVAYSFLRKNCRGPAVALNIPHISLIEVGMIYYV